MRISGLHHVSIVVSDTARALAFYRDVLGLVAVTRPDLGYPGAWIELGGRQLHLLELPNPDPVTGRPLHVGRDRHMAFLVDDLAACAARLERAGMACTHSRSGRAALFCRDPDGNGIEIIEDGIGGASAAGI
ncbi:MAG: VOC family protein [Gammaproteobacteria bacterium]|nr:VOC family protein [Gammaproteobacteria bacterium]